MLNMAHQSYMTARISKMHTTSGFCGGTDKGFLIAHIGYMVQGTGIFEVNDKTFSLMPGEIVFTPPGIPYKSTWTGQPDIEYYTIEIETPLFPTTDFLFCKIPGSTNYEQLFKNIYDCAAKEEMLSALGNIYILLNSLEKVLLRIQPHENSLIYKSKKYIEKYFDKDISVLELAKISNLSESYFYHKFKEETGYSPIDYKNFLRTKQAIVYLVYKNYTLEKICEKLNFSSVSHLRKMIMKFTGKSPNQIKKDNLSI